MKKTIMSATPGLSMMRLLLTLVLACTFCAPAVALADTGANEQSAGADVLTLGGVDNADAGQIPAIPSTKATVVKSGKWGTCPWELDSNGVLTVRPGNGVAVSFAGGANAPWNSKELGEDIKRIVFKEENGKKVVAPANCSLLFQGLSVPVDFSGFDTTKVTDMSSMFSMPKLKGTLDLTAFDTSNVKTMGSMFAAGWVDAIDLSSFDTSKVENMNGMFYQSPVKTIYASERWTTAALDKAKQSNNYQYGMFHLCMYLVGGNGTKYDKNHVGYEYARIDKKGAPGYLTYKAAPTPAKVATTWTRLWGNTQFDTMAKVVQAGWKKGSGDTVILATAVNFPDALSASGVAGLFGAPVLLTNKASLPAQTRSELARIKPSRVIIAGGPGAIKTSVDAQVKAACGVKPTRCYGSTASDTAAKLATTYVKKSSDTAILATSKFFYDSLSAAPVAYAKHYPILLADSKDAVSKNTLNAMKSCGIKKVIIVGGTSVIGPKIVSTLKANGISVAERLGGRTYYDTSRIIAQWALANGMSANRMGVATSYKFYDALTGASLCGKNNAVLVLADDKGRANASVAKANKSKISQGYVFGGVNAVGKSTFDALEAATK